MNIFFKSMIGLALVLGIVGVQAQTVTFTNASQAPIWLHPVWGGNNNPPDKIDPGGSIDYQSGINFITAFNWDQELTATEKQAMVACSGISGVICIKRYSKAVSWWNLNLGLKVTIFGDGGFNIPGGGGVKEEKGSAASTK
jgi:hypothetical protein